MSEVATIVLQVPIPEEANEDELTSILEIVASRGFSMDGIAAQRSIKIYVREAGISTKGITAAVQDSKERGQI